MGAIAGIFRHPIKGFTPQAGDAAVLSVGLGFPGDRLMAVEDGPSGFDPAAPAFISKSRFTVLAREAAIAKVRTNFDLETEILVASAPGSAPFRGDMGSDPGREAFAAWLREALDSLAPGAFSGKFRVLHASGHRFFDHPKGHVSILNLASVRDLGERMGAKIDPARFRANLLVEGWAPWAENGWTGREISLGPARGRVFAPIVRCAATIANPATGERDQDVPAALHQNFGNLLCGVYAHVEAPGEVRLGDLAEPL